MSDVAPCAPLQEIFEVLSKAAQLQYTLRGLRWKSSIGLWALDQLGAGMIVTDSGGRVIEMNPAAERIVRLDDGLTIQNRHLGARCAIEDAKLAKLIAAAAAVEKTSAAAGRILVGRSEAGSYMS